MIELLSFHLNSTVQISYIGYNTQEVKITSTTQTLNIKMVEDSETLDEVVVVGYGVQKKVNLSGSVSSVSSGKNSQSSSDESWTGFGLGPLRVCV